MDKELASLTTKEISMPLVIDKPKLKVIKSGDKHITPAKNPPGYKPLPNTLPLKYPVVPQTPSPSPSPPKKKEEEEDKPSESTTGVKASYKYVVGKKEFLLGEVKGECIPIVYTFLTTKEYSLVSIEWDKPLPNIPLLLEMRVGRTITRIELSIEFMERSFVEEGHKVKTSFRRVSDVRGYNDTFLLADWSVSDVCFFLRTTTLNYLVDSHPLSSTLATWKAIVWKHELMSKERFTKLSGSSFDLSEDDVLKIERIKGVESELGDF
jgi:hypothetical protein